MVIEEALADYMNTYSGLTAIVAKRISPLLLPQNPTLPAVVFQLVSNVRVPGFSADFMAIARFQITGWATTLSTASSIFEQLRAALQNYLNSTMGGVGGLTVSAIEIEDEQSIYEDDTQRYGKMIEIAIYYTEA